MVCTECNESCFGCGCVLPKLSPCLQPWGAGWQGFCREAQQAWGRALRWQREAGVCSWLWAKGASQAMGTALPGQGCKCQVQAVPLQTWGWHQTQLPAESGPAVSQHLPASLACVSKVPRHVALQCAVCTPGSVVAHKGCQCSLVCPQGGSPVSLCSVQHMVACAPVPTSACFPVLLGLVVGHDVLLW